MREPVFQPYGVRRLLIVVSFVTFMYFFVGAVYPVLDRLADLAWASVLSALS